MTSRSFSLLADVPASTKRAPARSGGKVGAATTNISSLFCTPLDAVSAEIIERLGTNAPTEALQTFVQGSLDIVPGDILVVSGTEYPIRAVLDGDWRPDGTTYRQLILEELK